MSKPALEGVRILDLSWNLAGPFGASKLADMGAEVIKIETSYKLDGLRTFGPWHDGIPTPPNRSGLFENRNRNKLSMTLDLRTPGGVEIFKRLVKISDAIIENYHALTMERFGLGYSVLSKVSDKIIMVSLPGFGQSGPYRDYTSFGPLLQAISGFTSLTGYTGQRPIGASTPVYDFTGGLFAALVILAGLEYRRRTGKGQYFDLSQFEIGVSLMGHLIGDYTANNRIPQLIGNRHPYASPHGCYRCKGEDRWCVIAVFSEEEWESFCDVIGNPHWTEYSRFATVLDRKRNEDELDKLVEEWTINHQAEEVMKLMQQAGVAAGTVQNIEDLVEYDVHMRDRDFYQETYIPPIGKVLIDGIPFRFSATPGSLRAPAPLLGEHTNYVLQEILKMSPEEISRYREMGVFK
jgi:crotonobetainyl-CoA:carnitine CoA-transferase CaiB-like acyl-CoA transferase